MAVVLRCPRCRMRLQVPRDSAGRQAKCAVCNTVFTVEPGMVADDSPETLIPAAAAPPPPISEPISQSSPSPVPPPDTPSQRPAPARAKVPPGTEPPPINPFSDAAGPRAGGHPDSPRFDPEIENYENPFVAPTGAAVSGYPSHRGALICALGGMALFFSLLTPCCCFFSALPALGLGIVAVVMGHADLSKMNRRPADPVGRGLTMAGTLMGWGGIAISALLFLLFVVMSVFG